MATLNEEGFADRTAPFGCKASLAVEVEQEHGLDAYLVVSCRTTRRGGLWSCRERSRGATAE
jgi:hypothetical protein